MAGQSATFSVQVSQPAAVQYQWYANRTAIDGATSSSYTVASPDVSQSGTSFDVAVSNGGGWVSSKDAMLTVVPIEPALAFAPIPTLAYGSGAITLSASSASAAPVSYTVVSGPGTLSGSTLTITGTGTVLVAASQPGTGNYAAAAAQASITVTPGTPSLKFAAIAPLTYGAAPITVFASSASDGAVSYAVVRGPATIAGNQLSVTGAGTVVLAASQSATGNFAAATVQTSFTVAPAEPSLKFAPIPSLTYGSAPISLSATSASDGTVSYAVLSGPATIAGNQISVIGAGPVVVVARQAATANFTAASAQTSFTIGPNVTLSVITPANGTFAPGQQAFQTTAVGGALNTVSWSANGGSFSGNTWTSPNRAGTYTITATSVDQPARSASTTVTVSAPVIITQPAARNVCSAAPLSLSVAAQYASEYQWFLNSSAIPGAKAATFSIASAAAGANGGIYTVAVTNLAGTVVSDPVTVSVGSQIVAQPADSSVVVPQTASLSVAALGQAPFLYQWFSLSPTAAAPVAIAGATSASYAPLSSAAADGTKYFASVTDRCGAVLTSNQATVTVKSAPLITTQPSLNAIAAASTPTLRVAATGNPALSYQWYWVPSGLHVPMPVAGATAASYTVPAAATTNGNNGDTYYVVVSNTLGQATSSPISLAITSASATNQWVVGWGASPENAIPGAQNPGGNNQSFRSLFYPTISGTVERVHFSNLYNTVPVTIGAARLAVATSGSAVDPTHDAPLTFNGQTSLTLAPGQETVSDPVQVPYTFGRKLAVSLYVSGSYRSLTQHESQVNVNYATSSGVGNTTADAVGASFTQSNTEWFLLSGVDVYGAYQGTVALFGSSSIDGHGSDDGDTNSYPAFNTAVPGQDNDRPSDWLARQLHAAGYTIGVLNAGTIGNPAARNARTATGVTVAGIDRFNHDVLQQAGVKTAVIYTGGIDLRSDCLPATNVAASLTNIVNQAREAGVRVILGTIPPSQYCLSVQPLPNSTYPYNGDQFMGPLNPSPENPGSTQRRLLNAWIRNTAPSLPGVVGIADFDSVLADPSHPDFLIPNYISADVFHPNGVGYGVQSSAIPLNLILP